RLAAALGDGYAVERTLGQGSFAVVFLVHDLALKRNLAVKVLSPDMITSKSVGAIRSPPGGCEGMSKCPRRRTTCRTRDSAAGR
ncbi:MAG TPA: hypothetical protein VF929_00455, partial [Gemmatimonadaceae bacterium]